VLGDNIFYGQGFSPMLEESIRIAELKNEATIFGYRVKDPNNFGVIEFDKNEKVLSVQEKPKNPKSNYAAVGLYFYPNKVIQISKTIKPSDRGELEITTVNQVFLEEGSLNVKKLGRGFAWLDTGTHESLAQASNFIETLEKRQGIKIACLEEIAFGKGWISSHKLREVAEPMNKNDYGQYLLTLIEK
jgi:glucose-1-phosphate thymidylyltransferase